MYFDNLTIAGVAVASVTALLPLLFGKEALRVREEDTSSPSPHRPEPTRNASVAPDAGCDAQPEPCR